MSFWGELKRRGVFKVGVAYLVASWLIIQVVDVLTEPLGLPDFLDTVVVVLLAIGLPFALIIAWVYEVTPQGIEVTADTDAARQAASPPGQRLTYVVIVLLMMAAGLMVLEGYVLAPSSGEFGPGSRVAVLPCDDLSPDPTDSFFSVGIHEELLNRLVSLSGLEVISRTSVQRYAAARPRVPQIGAELNVDVIIECSVRYSGDRVLLTVQLVDAVSDTHLWSQAYPADMGNLQSLFDIQAEIAISVANTLRIEFFEQEREQIERAPTESREAYEFYLAALEVGRSITLGTMSQRLDLVEAAIDRDPNFALAWSLKASTHSNLVQVGPADRIAREQDAAEAAALRAIELEPGLGAAYAQLGYTLSQQQKWIEAEHAYRRAEALGYANTGGNAYGILLMAAGKFSRAHEVHLIARDIDPLNPTLRAFLIASQGLDGAIDEALQEHARARALYGEFEIGDSFAFLLRLAAGEIDSADDITLTGLVSDAVKPYFDTPARAVEVLRELSVDPAYSSQTLQTQAAIWAGYFGAPELALDILQELIARNSQHLYAVWFPQLAAMRQLPEFKTMLREVGFLEYWKEFGWPDICIPLPDDDFECE